MSKKNVPLDFKSPTFRESLKVNPLKVLAYQKSSQSNNQPKDPNQSNQKTASVPRHKNIAKPQTTKQAKELPYKTKMCPLGRDCKKQFTCRFAHHQKQLRKPFYKRTKPCLLYQRGMCSLGSACRQYHGNFDLKNWNQKNYKKKLCEDYQKGDCPKKQLCVNAHGKQELEQYANLEEQQIVNTKPETEKNPIVIQVNTYKPNTYTMEIVEENLQNPAVQIIESFDLFNKIQKN